MIRPFLLALTLAATPALATTQDDINASLQGDEQLWEGLRWLAIADEIRKNCSDGFEARTLRATSRVLELYNRARDYGYSRDQIRAFQRADSTEARMRREVLAYFAQNGVREGVSETYCALGRSEVASGSPAGTLLRAR